MTEPLQDVRYEKQCPCRGTSSGPRIVMQIAESLKPPQVAYLTGVVVDYACDMCDKPWKRTDNSERI